MLHPNPRSKNRKSKENRIKLSPTFMILTNNIVSDLSDICIMIYLDDILIYSNNISVYCQYIKKVLKYLYKAGFYAKAEKYKFYSELVEYLEYILSFFSLTMSNNKVKIIQNWLEFKNIQFFQILLTFTTSLFLTIWTLLFY